MALPNSTLRDDIQLMGKGTARRVRTVTEAYTATVEDDVIIAAGAAPFTITLPTAASAFDAATQTGKELTFVNVDTDDATIDGSGAETINGAANFVLDVQYETVTLISNGTEWFAI
jgi:hypothetical protein